jgi:hypothetical protein
VQAAPDSRRPTRASGAGSAARRTQRAG